MKKPKPLTRKQYMAKFSRSARWRLSPLDAAEAISDYHEMVYQEERDESKLAEELGDPVQAAWLLTDAKEYKRWMRVFTVLAFGLFLMAKWAWTGWVSIRFSFGEECQYPVWVMAVGLLLSLIWFRRHGQKNGPVSKLLFLSLAIVLIAGCGVMYGIWFVSDFRFYEQVSDNAWQLRQQVYLVITAMMYAGVFSALAAFSGLALARCQDRRWLALYVLGLTAAAMIGFVTLNLKGMDLSVLDANELRPYLFARLFPIGAVGLIGTGVALC